MTSTSTSTIVAPPVGTRRLLAVQTTDLAEHTARLGPVPPFRPDGLVETLREAGLDGRGGAGFPLWRKLDAVRNGRARARGPLVVANGAEGESASSKDAVLLTTAPHLVLDGLALAMAAVGASGGVVATTARLAPAVERALADRTMPAAVTVRTVRDSFVSGEASAVASTATGGPGRPLDRTVRLAERGPDGRATLVSNVETLATAALIARFGAAWFRSVGSPSAPGTRLVTVSGDVGSPGVLEVAGGTTLDTVLAAAGGVSRGVPLGAVLVGGHGGTWLPAAATSAAFDPDGLAPWGADPGAGIVVALAADRCPLVETASIAALLAAATAGQCGPCVNGLPRIADTVAQLAAAPSRGSRAHPALAAEVLRVAALVDGRGACHHPDGVARMVRSAMHVFRADVDAHLAGHCVRAGVVRHRAETR